MGVKAVLVSGNPGKLRELRRLLPSWEIAALDTHGIGDETGATFEENARAKALWGRPRAETSDWVVGEDSGLECDALGGSPGIRSARFAGLGAADEENVEKLLADLAGFPPAERTARYRCAIVAIDPDANEYVGHGCLEGMIAEWPSGTGGFGYDPIFIPVGERETVGELPEGWKDRFSHRANAARALLATVGREPSP